MARVIAQRTLWGAAALACAAQALFCAEAPPEAGSVCRSARHGLELTGPPGWRVIDERQPKALAGLTGGAGVMCAFQQHAKEPFPAVLLQWNGSDDPVPASMDAFAQTLRETNSQIKAQTPSLEILEEARVVTIGERPFVRDIKALGLDIYLYYHLLEGPTGYSLIARFPRADQARYEQLVNAVAKTLKFQAGRKTGVADLATPEELVSLAWQHFQARDFDRAAQLGEQALTGNLSKADRKQTLFLLSSAYLDMGLPPYVERRDATYFLTSIRYGEQCLALDPTFWLAAANLGTVYMNMDKLEQSDRYFRQALEHADRDSPGYQQLRLQTALVGSKLEALREQQAAQNPRAAPPKPSAGEAPEE